MKRRGVAAHSFLMASILLVAHADQHVADVQSDGETVVTASSTNPRVRVAILVHEVDIGKSDAEKPIATHSNCTYSRFPCSVVDSIGINVNGKPIYVPRSVYSDLADLNSAEIQVGRSELTLTLKGGDASESYIVLITFDKQRIKKRVLSSGLSPAEPLQETVYHKVVVGD